MPAFDEYWEQKACQDREAALNQLSRISAELLAPGDSRAELTVSEFLLRYVAVACAHPDVFVALHGPHVMALCEREFFGDENPLFRLLSDHVTRAVARGELHGDHRHITTVLLAVTHGLALTSISWPRTSTSAAEAFPGFVPEAVDAVLSGLRRRPDRE